MVEGKKKSFQITAKTVKRVGSRRCLVTSSRSQGQQHKRPGDRTSNAGVVVRAAEGIRWTAF